MSCCRWYGVKCLWLMQRSGYWQMPYKILIINSLFYFLTGSLPSIFHCLSSYFDFWSFYICFAAVCHCIILTIFLIIWCIQISALSTGMPCMLPLSRVWFIFLLWCPWLMHPPFSVLASGILVLLAMAGIQNTCYPKLRLRTLGRVLRYIFA